MKRNSFSIRSLQAFACAVGLVWAVGDIRAATHVVDFGGSLGFKYSPASFSAAVGDTVKWVGDFTMHPLSSTTIPTNAQTWHVTSGSSFNYRITVAGDYNYKCDLHVGAGMTGSFKVVTTRVRYDAPLSQTGASNNMPHVNIILSKQSYAPFIFPRTASRSALKMYDVQGRERSKIMDDIVSEGAVIVRFNQKY